MTDGEKNAVYYLAQMCAQNLDDFERYVETLEREFPRSAWPYGLLYAVAEMRAHFRAVQRVWAVPHDIKLRMVADALLDRVRTVEQPDGFEYFADVFDRFALVRSP